MANVSLLFIVEAGKFIGQTIFCIIGWNGFYGYSSKIISNFKEIYPTILLRFLTDWLTASAM